jgi:hypothetical protein
MTHLPAVITSVVSKQSSSKQKPTETDIKDSSKTSETQVHLQKELQH